MKDEKEAVLFTFSNNHTMNICIVVGARPNFMKVAPIIRAVANARERGEDINKKLVYTGTEHDTSIEPSLFEDLQISRPDVYLGVECASLNELTGRVMGEFEKYLAENPTDVVIVVDDLASTMATAIVTKKQGITLAHLVAGTRSFDINMPKEINRLVIDGLSDLLFTVGDGSFSVVCREGASLNKIYLVGNILMDTLRFNHSRLKQPAIFDSLHLKKGGYIVFTLNRKALIDNKENMKKMLTSLSEASNGIPIIAPLRKEAKEVVDEWMQQHAPANHIFIVHPLSYLEFGYLTCHAKGIVTDSGNVAEEATFNGIPCITLNSYTEHIETVRLGSNVLVGEDAEKLRLAVKEMISGEWKKCSLPDRWDGRTAERIIQILLSMQNQ